MGWGLIKKVETNVCKTIIYNNNNAKEYVYIFFFSLHNRLPVFYAGKSQLEAVVWSIPARYFFFFV
jgi:hypothetical protein